MKAVNLFGKPVPADPTQFIHDKLAKLEAYFLEIKGDGLWCKDHKSTSSHFFCANAALAITNASADNPLLSDVDCVILQAYFSAAQDSAKQGGRALKPFDDWVKTAT